MPRTQDNYTFDGFSAPNYTQVPDEFFDEVMPHLGEAELRAGLYIIRRTFGFKKQSDPISFNQFLHGITTADGRQLDNGCGVHHRTNLSKALKGLEDKGLIEAVRSWSARGDACTTVYRLRFRTSAEATKGVVPQKHHPSAEEALPVVPQKHLQEIASQKIVKQQTEEKSLRHSSSEISPSNRTETQKEPREGEERIARANALTTSQHQGFTSAGALLTSRYVGPSSVDSQQHKISERAGGRSGHKFGAVPEPNEQQAIRAYMQELRRRFVDHAKLTSTATRAWRLFERARQSYPAMDLNGFTGYLEQAASITADRQGEIQGGQMAYLFTVVESLLWPEQQRTVTRPSRGGQRGRSIGGPLVRVTDRHPTTEHAVPDGAVARGTGAGQGRRTVGGPLVRVMPLPASEHTP